MPHRAEPGRLCFSATGLPPSPLGKQRPRNASRRDGDGAELPGAPWPPVEKRGQLLHAHPSFTGTDLAADMRVLLRLPAGAFPPRRLQRAVTAQGLLARHTETLGNQPPPRLRHWDRVLLWVPPPRIAAAHRRELEVFETRNPSGRCTSLAYGQDQSPQDLSSSIRRLLTAAGQEAGILLWRSGFQ